MRVPGTKTYLILCRYGDPIHIQTFLDLVAKAQYQLVETIAAARGDGPAPQQMFEWLDERLLIRIGRPRAQSDLTWLMLADMLEGLRLFFAEMKGWFETSITIIDDTAGPVASGYLTFL